MKELPVCEAKAHLLELLAEAEQGEQVVITRRGVAVARLVGAGPAATPRSMAMAMRQRVIQGFAQLAELRRDITLDMPLRDAVEHGRDCACPS